MFQRALYHAEIPPGPLRRRARLALDALQPEPDAVRHFLAEFPLDLEDAADALAFSGSERVRNLVARGDHAEMYICTWLPGQGTPIRQRDTTPYGLRVIAGALTEDVYARTADGEAAEPATSRVLETGAVTVHDAPVVHRLKNAGPHLTVTVHIAVRGRARPRALAEASPTDRWRANAPA